MSPPQDQNKCNRYVHILLYIAYTSDTFSDHVVLMSIMDHSWGQWVKVTVRRWSEVRWNGLKVLLYPSNIYIHVQEHYTLYRSNVTGMIKGYGKTQKQKERKADLKPYALDHSIPSNKILSNSFFSIHMFSQHPSSTRLYNFKKLLLLNSHIFTSATFPSHGSFISKTVVKKQQLVWICTQFVELC